MCIEGVDIAKVMCKLRRYCDTFHNGFACMCRLAYDTNTCTMWCLMLLRLCPITVYRDVIWGCVVLILNAFVLFSLLIITLLSCFIVMVTSITGMYIYGYTPL